MPDYSEYLQGLEKSKAAPTVDQWTAHLRTSRMVALKMEDLEHGEEWAIWKAHMLKLKEQDEKALADVEAQLHRPSVVGDAALSCRMQIQRLLGQITGYTTALDLPQHLIKGDKVLQSLDETKP